MLAETFLLMEPYWALRTSSVPLWLKFTTDVSADALEAYLDCAQQFDHIDLLLFQHGVRSAGLVPIERWRALLGRARRTARFVALRPERHPSSSSTYVYYIESLRRVERRYDLPPALRLAQVDEFIRRSGSEYRVEWIEGRGQRAAEERAPAAVGG